MTLEDLADDLYGRFPEEFVAARDDAVRKARTDGDPELAAALAKLRRPTVGAWLTNLLIRQHRHQVTGLVELGSALRDAQSSLDGEALRELARQRQQVVSGLVGLARRKAAELGHPVGASAAGELESTLVAALADPDAADQVLAGRLTTALVYAGLGFGAAAGAVRPESADRQPPAPRKPRASAAQPPDEGAEHAALVDEAERALAAARLHEAEVEEAYELAGQDQTQARAGVEAAQARAERAGAQLAAAQTERAAATAEVEQSKARLDAAKRELSEAGRDRTQARRAVEQARKALDRVSR